MSLKKILTIVSLLAVVACSGTKAKLQNFNDRRAINDTIGKNYNTITNETSANFSEGFSNQALKYGKFLSSYNLADGSKVMRHTDTYSLLSSGFGLGVIGVTGLNTKANLAYRIFYFKVGNDGIIKDWANGVSANATGTQECSGLGVGGFSMESCGDIKGNAPVAEIDSIARTSTEQPLSSWGKAL